MAWQLCLGTASWLLLVALSCHVLGVQGQLRYERLPSKRLLEKDLKPNAIMHVGWWGPRQYTHTSYT